MPKVTVVRCPRCGSTDAASDEARSAYDFTHMQCHGCGYGALVDEWQLKDEWNVTLELAEGAPLPPRVVVQK